MKAFFSISILEEDVGVNHWGPKTHI